MAYYYNDKKFENRNDFLFFKRGFGEITNEEELIAYAEKVSYGFQYAGHRHNFIDAYLSDYALERPYCELTDTEFQRLRDIQKRMRAEEKAKDEARSWELIETRYWADNSVDQIWRAKDGEEKVVTVVHAHGDCC